MGSMGTELKVQFDHFNNIVNGQARSSAKQYHGIDPTTQEALWDVPMASIEDIDDAVNAANRAFVSWSTTTTWTTRVQRLAEYGAVLVKHEDDFVKLLIRETAKPAQVAAQEFQIAMEYYNWHLTLEEPKMERYEDEEKIIENIYVPMGVAAAICPWNSPILLSLAKIAPAVLAGNTIIVKPSPFTPYTALKLVEIAQQIFPPGVVQVLGGGEDLGPALVTHPGIHKISFTGSIATGKRIVQASAATLKRVTLELGGNDPSIVLADVDIAAVAQKVALGAFYMSGQVCVAIKRIFIHDSIYDEFVRALVQAANSLKVGAPYEENVMVGPIQNKMQYQKAKGFFEDSKAHKYKFAGGEAQLDEHKGFFLPPTIIDNPPIDSRIYAEEPFGPIVPCQPYHDVSDAIARANDTQTGLGATVFGRDVKEAERVARQIESGSVWVNSYPTLDPKALFGGVKQSGLGTEFGTLGIRAFLNTKAIHISKS